MTITLYQQAIAWLAPADNRQRAEQALANAPESDILVLPETFTTGFGDQMAGLAEEPEGPTLQWARRIAQQHNALLVATWIVHHNGHYYNRLHWVYPDGTYGYYDKAHTFRVSSEATLISRGTQRPTFEWRGWRIRPAVCYDLRFPTWLRNTPTSPTLDYDLLLICANWPVSRIEAWTTLLHARAIENLCYVAACNRTGTDATGTLYNGNSLIINHKGQTIASPTPNPLTPNNETTLTATLDKTALDTFRQRWPFHLDFD